MSRERFLLIVIIVIFGAAILHTEYTDSFKTINEALYSEESSLEAMRVKQVIGGSEYGKKAFYFFLNNDNQVVGVTLNQGIFGWKWRGAMTGTGSEVDIDQKLTKSSVSSSNETKKFYYGLISYENTSYVVVNDKRYATLINLKEVIADGVNVENTYLWYTYVEDNDGRFTLKVYDDENNLIDSE